MAGGTLKRRKVKWVQFIDGKAVTVAPPKSRRAARRGGRGQCSR